jgi:hypothetical protein
MSTYTINRVDPLALKFGEMFAYQTSQPPTTPSSPIEEVLVELLVTGKLPKTCIVVELDGDVRAITFNRNLYVVRKVG